MIIQVNDEYYLSEPLISDVDSYVKLLNDKEIYKNTWKIPFPYLQSNAEWFINYTAGMSGKYGHEMEFAIRNQYQGLIGGIGLHGAYGKDSHKDEVGYWISAEYRNMGIMSQVLKRFSSFVTENYGLVRLEARVFEHNQASAKVLEKCGYVREGLLKKNVLKDGKYFDIIMYAFVK
jgi:ribosomal-protein-alanine N-acetyltransferase